jgi:hypothetical protein
LVQIQVTREMNGSGSGRAGRRGHGQVQPQLFLMQQQNPEGRSWWEEELEKGWRRARIIVITATIC